MTERGWKLMWSGEENRVVPHSAGRQVTTFLQLIMLEAN
jgi:hypothetical protein